MRRGKMPAKSPVLVVAAHPDDEVLGCGASIAKFAADGHAVYVAFLADGVGSRRSAKHQAEMKQRRKAAQVAAKVLGVKTLFFGDFPDNRMDSVDLLDVVQVVESLVAKHRPVKVFTHHVGDLNIDHRVTSQAVVTACRPQRGQSVRELLFFEVPSSTEWQTPGAASPFEPNWFVDVSATLPAKMKALKAYDAEMRAWPHPRSYQAVEHLARWRGAAIGVDAAEAFVVGRMIA
jgi:N-acetylglucosamine malate deacetylase 1